MTDSTDAPVRGSAGRGMTLAWLALTAITVASWWLAPAHAAAGVAPSIPITAMVLALAAVKVRLIFTHFMEVRTAPRWLKVSTGAWLAALIVAVFAIYLI